MDYKIGMYVTLINWEKRILDIKSIQLLEFRYFYVKDSLCHRNLFEFVRRSFLFS